jgi:hypothetical protein
MAKFSFGQYAKTAGAFVVTTTVGAEFLLGVADGQEWLDPGSWYTHAPMLIIGAACLPASIALFERMLQLANPKPGRIRAHVTDANGGIARKIPYNKHGRPGVLLANTVPFKLGEPKQRERRDLGPMFWSVPVATDQGENTFTVHEKELREFLEAASRRKQHQFSRRYWTERRRPPLLRPKYEAMMRLLQECGLVEGRHADGRSSGRLVLFPRECMMIVKNSSPWAGQTG